LKIDTYYDIGCDCCGRHASTDFEAGMFETKKLARKWAKDNGWKTKDKRNICHMCLKSETGK
jgi:hypothetical protein